MLSTPLCSGCLFSPSINWTQRDTHPHLDTYQVRLQSPLREGARGIKKEHHRAYISPDHQSCTPPSLLQAHCTPPLEVQPAPYRASSSTHTTAPSIAYSTVTITSSLHTAPSSAASTVPQCPPATEFPKPTWKSLTISESRLWHCRLAHIHPTALRSLIDGYSKTTQCAPHASKPSTSRRSS